jgi:hypothetical protein
MAFDNSSSGFRRSRASLAATKPLPLSKRKKFVFFALYSLVLALVFSLTAEVALRLKGYAPYSGADVAVRVEPGGRFYQQHPTLGYTQLPGRFTVFFWDTSFVSNHLPNTLRITHPLETYGEAKTKDEVWIFGCSFTEGWGLKDDETYPWLMQEKFPEYEIVNFGVGGYGTIHSLIQFREALAAKTPKVAVLAYANFHDERNTFSRQRQKWVVTARNLGPIAQPYARFDGQGNLQYLFGAGDYKEFPLMRYSALAHYIEIKYNQLEERSIHSHDVSKALILEMAKIANEHHVKFVVAGIASSDGTLDMLNFAREHGISSIDISVDLKAPANRLSDGHPSAVANRQFADKLAGFLRTEVLPADR